ncbi:hypothetical protein [Sporosarcina sp. NPDC096371]|uniref:hypothetical protein n=1 Tax=Sporosarcina sp. NPDC096371 TaxID=3364530 RepID=UPI0037FC836C
MRIKRNLIRNTIISSPLFIIFCLSLSIIWEISYIKLSIPLLILLLVFIVTLKEFTNKETRVYFILISLIKFCFLIYQAKFKNLPMGGNDWVGYLRHAENLLNNSTIFLDLLIIADVNLFSRIMAVIFYFFDINLPVINVFVFICSLVLVKFTHKTAKLLTESAFMANLSALLISIWPISFIFGITILREIPIQLACMMSIYYFIKCLKKYNFSSLLLSFTFAVIAASFHSGMIALLLVYFIILCFYNFKKKRIGLRIQQFALVFFVLIVVFMTPISNTLFSKFDSINNVDDLVEVSSYSAGNTAYITGSASSLQEIIVQSPYRLIMFSAAPLPWQVINSATLMAWLIDGIPRMVLLWGIVNWISVYKPKNDTEKVIKFTLISSILFIYIIHAMGTANYGTAMRHRSKTLSLEIIILLWGIAIKRKKRIKNG